MWRVLVRSLMLVSIVSLVSCAVKVEDVRRGVNTGNNEELNEVRAADTVFRNGSIYTVNPERPWAEALAVRGQKIIAVGKNSDMAALIGPQTQLVDLDGRFMMPGLHDMHLHMLGATSLKLNINIDPLASDWQQIVSSIQNYAAQHPEKTWLFGGNLPWLRGAIGEFADKPAHKSTLDSIIADRPLALFDMGQHAMLLNSKALEMAGIDNNTPNPTGGSIERDEQGEATGVLRELGVNLVTDLIQGPSVDELAAALPQTIAQLNSVGITSGNEVWVYTLGLQALKQLDDNGKLNIRLGAAITHPVGFVSEEAKQAAQDLIDHREDYRGDRLMPDFVKFSLDGAGFESAMVEPFEGTEIRGKLRIPEAVLIREVSTLHAMGVGAVIHAGGDRAVRIGLNAIEQSIIEHGKTGARHVIAHSTIINPADRDRFKALGAIAEFSPYFWWPTGASDSFRNMIGDERFSWVWAMGDMLERGALVAAGSDWPVVTDPNPFPAIEGLITRQDPSGLFQGQAFNPEQAISLKQALAVFTLGGAYELKQEDRLGSIEVGKIADLIVLDRNLFEVPVVEISGTKVLQTWLDGELIYRADNTAMNKLH